MLEIIPKNTNFDFVGKRKIWIVVSILSIIATCILLATKGLNYGIDFSGGAELQLKFKNSMSVSDLRETMEKAGFKNLVIQQLGDASQNEFLLKVHAEETELQQVAKKSGDTLAAKMPKGDFEIQRADVVGPQAGGELRKSGFLSIFYTMLCILLYVALRFDFRYAPGAVAALVHDSVLTLGVYVLTQKEFSLQTVAAILTIIGYSNNDTIIVFDRVRETLKNHPGRSLEENINRSINETLSRTILTSMLTLVVVTALMIYGGGVIHDFAFAMMIGILVGTYSSVFIASPILIMMTHFQEARERRRRNGSGPVLGRKPAT